MLFSLKNAGNATRLAEKAMTADCADIALSMPGRYPGQDGHSLTRVKKQEAIFEKNGSSPWHAVFSISFLNKYCNIELAIARVEK